MSWLASQTRHRAILKLSLATIFTFVPADITFTLLRAVLLVNLVLLMVGLFRAGIATWQAERLSNAGSDVIKLDVVRRASSNRSSDKVDVSVGPLADAGPKRKPVRIGEDRDKDEEFQVPNIVHYIWFNTAPRRLEFHHMLSVLSAHKILDPEVIYVHTNIEPTGSYWDVVKALPKVKVMARDPPLTLFGEEVKQPFYYTSHSNVDRVRILMEYGGIYLDFDVIVTRPFDALRRHVCTIGLEQETKACGSVIVCSKSAFFLYLWINAYLDDYRIEEWAYNTGKVPYKLSRRYPHLVHVEKTRLNRPNFKELDQIWGPRRFDWEKNYAVHLWYRLWKDTSPFYQGVEPNPENIKTWNATFGEMARSVLYGSKDMMAREITLS